MFGLYFFEDGYTGNARTVTTETYIEMLDKLMSLNTRPGIWFQQNGATSHTASAAMEWL